MQLKVESRIYTLQGGGRGYGVEGASGGHSWKSGGKLVPRCNLILVWCSGLTQGVRLSASASFS